MIKQLSNIRALMNKVRLEKVIHTLYIQQQKLGARIGSRRRVESPP